MPTKEEFFSWLSRFTVSIQRNCTIHVVCGRTTHIVRRTNYLSYDDCGNDAGNLVFRHIGVKYVKNPLVIGEYDPRMLPPEGAMTPQPVARLTPHFHDVVLQNVTAT